MYSTYIMTHATVSSKSAAHNPQTFSFSSILLQQSYIVTFILHRYGVGKVAVIYFVVFAECSAGEVVLLA